MLFLSSYLEDALDEQLLHDLLVLDELDALELTLLDFEALPEQFLVVVLFSEFFLFLPNIDTSLQDYLAKVLCASHDKIYIIIYMIIFKLKNNFKKS